MTKAKRQTIALGDLELDVFQLPDGTYVMSQTQVAAAVGKDRQNLSNFLRSKWLKALPGEDRSCQTFEQIEIEGRGRDINAVPLDIAYLFWVFQVSQKNKEAVAIVVPLGSETLTRRADTVFGVARSEAEYQAATAEMMKLLGRVARERDVLLESYEIDDDARAIIGDLQAMLDSRDREIERLRSLIADNGLDLPE